MWASLLHSLLVNLGYPLYLALRVILHSVRDAIWWANGTKTAILKSRIENNKNGKLVQVLRITGRYKLDKLLSLNSLSDFIVNHEGFVSPGYLLKSEISLYCITPREFVFVQCAEGDTAWNVKDFGFSREGQFRKAKQVLLLPIQDAHHLADKLGAKQKLIFILNTGRCGSTLACQIFQNTGKCVAYAEPSVMNDLLKVASKPNDPAAEKLIKTTITLMCKPGQKSIVAHAIKPQSFCISMVPTIHRLFPEARSWFIYRDLVKSCISYMTIPIMPGAIFIGVSQMISWNLWLRIAVNNGILNPYRIGEQLQKARASSNLSFMASLVLWAMKDYLTYCNHDVAVSVPAFRYEDLVGNPTATLTRLFEHCGLPLDFLPAAMEDFTRDSQANSPVSKAKRSSLPKYVPSAKELEELQGLCNSFGVPDALQEEFVLPGTIPVDAK